MAIYPTQTAFFTVYRWLGPVLSALLTAPAAPAGIPGEQYITPLTEPPRWAELQADSSFIRREPSGSSDAIGILRKGDAVIVLKCLPGCDQSDAWLDIYGGGYARMPFFKWIDIPPAQPFLPNGLNYWYGRVLSGGSSFYEIPDLNARQTGEADARQMLALLPDVDLHATGWFRHLDGTYIPSSRVALFEPYDFRGEERPPLPMAFLIRKVSLNNERSYPRHTRFHAEGTDRSGNVVTSEGPLPRNRVRVAVARPRPDGIGPKDKWVHVDLREQVLVAYEGDQPVYATLISSGKKKTPSPEGVFTVWQKARHESMRGMGDDPYLVEEVPFILYFDDDIAIHGAFWHSQFGSPASHGCINLSVQDAAWLFAWAPPNLPVGWHSIVPDRADLPSLKVVVEKAPWPRLPRWNPEPHPETSKR